MWHSCTKRTGEARFRFNVPISCFIQCWKGLGSLKRTLTSCEFIPNGFLVRKSHKMTLLLEFGPGWWNPLSIIHLNIYEELNIFNCQPTGSIKLWPFQCSENFVKTWENGVQPAEQVTEKHYTGIQAEETEQSLELVQVLSEDPFLGRALLDGKVPQFSNFCTFFPLNLNLLHPASRKVSQINVGNGKIFWRSKLIVFFDVGWFWWLSSMEERYSQPVSIKSLQTRKMESPQFLNKVCLGFFWHY